MKDLKVFIADNTPDNYSVFMVTPDQALALNKLSGTGIPLVIGCSPDIISGMKDGTLQNSTGIYHEDNKKVDDFILDAFISAGCDIDKSRTYTLKEIIELWERRETDRNRR